MKSLFSFIHSVFYEVLEPPRYIFVFLLKLILSFKIFPGLFSTSTSYGYRLDFFSFLPILHTHFVCLLFYSLEPLSSVP